MNPAGRVALVPAGGYRFRHAARMEWTKLRSLRSTGWALLLVVAGMIGMGIVVMANTRAPVTDAQRAAFDPTNNVLAGVALGQLVIGVLGVLVMTGEYAAGTIRATLAAIPNRPLLLSAKAAVFGGVVLIVGEAVTFVAFLAGRAALTARAPHPALGQPGVLRAVAMSGAYLCLIGLLGLGLGAITRHGASAITILVGVAFVLPTLVGGLSRSIVVARYFPIMIAANSLAAAKPMAGIGDTRFLSPWAGLGMLCLYTAATLAVGGWLLARRDA